MNLIEIEDLERANSYPFLSDPVKNLLRNLSRKLRIFKEEGGISAEIQIRVVEKKQRNNTNLTKEKVSVADLSIDWRSKPTTQPTLITTKKNELPKQLKRSEVKILKTEIREVEILELNFDVCDIKLENQKQDEILVLKKHIQTLQHKITNLDNKNIMELKYRYDDLNSRFSELKKLCSSKDVIRGNWNITKNDVFNIITRTEIDEKCIKFSSNSREMTTSICAVHNIVKGDDEKPNSVMYNNTRDFIKCLVGDCKIRTDGRCFKCDQPLCIAHTPEHYDNCTAGITVISTPYGDFEFDDSDDDY